MGELRLESVAEAADPLGSLALTSIEPQGKTDDNQDDIPCDGNL